MAYTESSDILFNPVVWKDHIQAYFRTLLVWGQSATRFDDLTQGPGETLTWPFFKKVGAAEEPAEASSLSVDALGDDSFTSTVKEVGKAIGFTDKSLIFSIVFKRSSVYSTVSIFRVPLKISLQI